MQVRSTAAVGLLAAFVTACGGGPAATPGPDGGGGGATPGPQVTAGPVETQPGGGGGGGNTGGGSGQIHIEIGGPVQATVDQPFFAFGSRWAGDVAGVSLNFTSEGAEGIASISEVNDIVVVSWVTDELGANAQNCQLSNWDIGATSGSGSFDCRDGFATKADGTFLSGITMKGSFEASQ